MTATQRRIYCRYGRRSPLRSSRPDVTASGQSEHPSSSKVTNQADAYPGEHVAFGNGLVPIRLIDTKTATCQDIIRIDVSPVRGEFRVDAHPAWDRSGRYVTFNGWINNTRRVLVADLSRLLG